MLPVEPARLPARILSVKGRHRQICCSRDPLLRRSAQGPSQTQKPAPLRLSQLHPVPPEASGTGHPGSLPASGEAAPELALGGAPVIKGCVSQDLEMRESFGGCVRLL